MTASSPHAVRCTLMLIVLVSLAAAGCGANSRTSAFDGVSTGAAGSDLAGSWLDYYVRALAYLEEGLYAAAAKDLQQAVSGNDFDRRRLDVPDNTVIDYFPHRELGIIHYRKQEYTRAIEELEYSIESEPSARAHFFLDLARAARIARYSADRTAPQLKLETSSSREVTADLVKRVVGVAGDDTYVAAITVGRQSIPLEPAEKSHVFTVDVPLREGENVIRVTATDLSGKSSTRTLDIYGDRQGPLVEIIETVMENGLVTVSGNVSDTGGLASLKINGHLWPVTGHFAAYNFKFTQQPGAITITAGDRAGNRTEAFFDTRDFTGDAVGPADAAENQTASSRPGKQDPAGRPPQVYLEDMAGTVETSADFIVFRVRVSGNAPIHSIFVNTSPVLPKLGQTVFFSLKKELRPGDNIFHFIAVDQQGGRTDKKIIVTREIANIYQQSSRMNIAVLPFARHREAGTGQQDIAAVLADCFTGIDRFQTVPAMDAPREQKIPAVQAERDNNAVPGADGILTGSVNISSGHYEIIARMVDTRTSQVMAVHDVFGKVSTPDDAEDLACRLAEKFNRDFPVVQGMITEIHAEKATINLGLRDGIKPYSRFIIYRDSPPFMHPVMKRIIRSDPDIIGVLQITDVHEQTAAGEIIRRSTPVRKYDTIISR